MRKNGRVRYCWDGDTARGGGEGSDLSVGGGGGGVLGRGARDRWVVEGVYNDGTRSRVGIVERDGVRGQQQTLMPPAASMAAWMTALLDARCAKTMQA